MILFNCSTHGNITRIWGKIKHQIFLVGSDAGYHTNFAELVTPSEIVEPICEICRQPVTPVPVSGCPHRWVAAIHEDPMDYRSHYAIEYCSLCYTQRKLRQLDASYIQDLLKDTKVEEVSYKAQLKKLGVTTDREF